MHKKRPQMVDIARIAGVSTATVSRALSGSPLIPAETRKHVLSIAESLHYTVNAGAANLRTRRVSTVGVVILGESMQGVSDPFILHLFGSIADALDAQGYSVLFSRLNAKTEKQVFAQVHSGQVSGLIVIGQYTWHARLNQAAAQGIPMAVWGAHLQDANYAVVGGDNRLGGYLATEHLLQQGARRIAFLGDLHHPETALRHQGYLHAHAQAGFSPDPALCAPILFGEHKIAEIVQTWLNQGQRFDAILASSDVTAIALLGILKTHGLHVPHDVLVVGYDDIEMAAHVHPSITSVRQPTQEAGQALVQSLLQVMQQKKVSPVTLPTALIVRASSTRA